MAPELWLIRHGETAWSLSGAHTGTTDLPLTPEGEAKARGSRRETRRAPFRAGPDKPDATRPADMRTRRFRRQAQVEPNLSEWNYGSYEGLTSADIQRTRPGWYDLP